MDPISTFALLAAAAFGAGVLNAIAGGGTFLTFPALVWTGVPPIAANATSAPGSINGPKAMRVLPRAFVNSTRAKDTRPPARNVTSDA